LAGRVKLGVAAACPPDPSTEWLFAACVGYDRTCMEASMEVYPGITMDPEVRFGKPCIKGTRIDVATVLGRFAAGDKIEDIQEDYQLTRIKS
jgi:uncharacterized protein (DUF433 family)